MRFRTNSEGDTLAFGAALGAQLRAGDAVLLSGDLGAGKSVLARGIARSLGIEGPMPSPTFTIMIPYEGRQKFHHLDLYRLEGPDEFYAAGLEDAIGGDGIAVVEWPEMAELAPERCLRLAISRAEGADARDILMEMAGMEIDISALNHWRADA